MSDGDMVEAVARAILECVNQAPVPDEEWRKVMAGDANDVATLMSWGRAALSVIESREGWQDIATAPRDGTLLDLWVIEDGVGARYPESYWSAERQQWHGMSTWIWPESETVTHWRPLPEPPAIRTGEAEQ